jgi:hypothetical protein
MDSPPFKTAKVNFRNTIWTRLPGMAHCPLAETGLSATLTLSRAKAHLCSTLICGLSTTKMRTVCESWNITETGRRKIAPSLDSPDLWPNQHQLQSNLILKITKQ